MDITGWPRLHTGPGEEAAVRSSEAGEAGARCGALGTLGEASLAGGASPASSHSASLSQDQGVGAISWRQAGLGLLLLNIIILDKNPIKRKEGRQRRGGGGVRGGGSKLVLLSKPLAVLRL